MKAIFRMEDVLRPCVVHCKDGDKRGLFHGWFQAAWPYEAIIQGTVPGFIQRPQAVIEFEDGSVTQANAGAFHFLDSEGMFGNFYWDAGSGDVS